MKRFARSSVENLAWKPVGWQSLSVDVPGEWNIVAYGGDLKQGNLRIDNSDPNPRGGLGMEIRWNQTKGKLKPGDLQAKLEPVFAALRKTAKRQKTPIDTKSEAIADEAHPERDESIKFSWRGDRVGVGRLWHCKECERIVIAQVIGGPHENIGDAASRILRSMACHPPDPDWQLWSLYDLTTELPRDFQLVGQPQLMNIYVQLVFGRERTTDQVRVEQWGVANVQLKNAYLNDWFRTKNQPLDRSVRYDETEIEINGHPALDLTGKRSGLTYLSKEALPQLTRLQRPAPHFHARLWECPESNKIHLVQSLTRQLEPELAVRIAERTRCHS